MFEEIIQGKKDEIIEQVLACVRINSVRTESEEGKPFGFGPSDALCHTLKLAESMGFRTKNIDNMVGYAEYGEGEEMIAVLGHLDIVPIGEGWDFDPFGELHGDRIYGRGTLDDKGPIIGALFALLAVKESGVSLKRRIRIIFGTDEETGSRDVERYNETEEIPVMGFTPDADYPVIFSEKGLAGFSIMKKLTPKPGEVQLLSAKAGTAVNLVPDHAKAELRQKDGEILTLEFEGTSAHASTPEQGDNAITKLICALATQELPEELYSFVEFYHRFVGSELDGRSLGIACTTEEFGSTTVNSGLLEGDPEHIKVTFDCRYPAGQEIDKALQKVKEKACEYGLEMDIARDTPPLYIPKDSHLVMTLRDVYCQQTGIDAEPIVIGGGTYAKSMKNIVAFGPVFPDQENVIHQKNEYISIEHLLKNTEIAANAMYQLAK